VTPEEALERARAAAARLEADPDAGGMTIAPTDRVSVDRLLEWAVIEPDLAELRSTRRLGGPITWAKRAVFRVLRQYLRQLEAQQTRFNLHVALKLAELEDRERPPGP
jgi:hypothetical protein